eukprot:13787-Amphidinium_carterae.2
MCHNTCYLLEKSSHKREASKQGFLRGYEGVVQAAETEGLVDGHRTPSVPDDVQEPEAEADLHGSDMFASAVSAVEAETAVPPPPPIPRQHAEAARMRAYRYSRRDGKLRRLRPRQFRNLERGMTSYQYMLQLVGGVITDSDDEGELMFE